MARQPLIVCLLGAWVAMTSAFSQQTAATPDWRVWTSVEGVQIEAFLQEVQDGQVVIMRRDGQQFTAPLERFSPEDRQYVTAFLDQQLPSAAQFREIDFTEVDLSDRHQIEDVPHVRQRAQDPLGTAAIQMVMNFHGIEIPEIFSEQLAALELRREELIAAADIANALQNLPVETEIIRFSEPGVASRPLPADVWEANISGIRTAISWNLPVVLAYFPVDVLDSPPNVVVAMGYDQRRLEVIDPVGGRSPFPIDTRDLEFQFVYAIVIFPTAEGVVDDVRETRQLSREFLSAISTGIRQAPSYTPFGVTEHLASMGLEATIRDVNRQDLGGSQGQTRSFARSGGLTFIDTSLEVGKVVIVPQEFETQEQTGLALIYGRSGDNYQAVVYLHDRSFQHEPVARAEIARRWLTRENRTYRLDLIEIVPPGQPGGVQQTAGAAQQHARQE